MKKVVLPSLLLALSSLSLFSCSASSSSSTLKGNIDDYYKIDFYSDYKDMDYSNPSSWDKTKAKHLGYGYIAKENSSSKQDSLSLTYIDEENKDYNYKASSKEAPSYFDYEFAGFKTTSGESINKVTFTSSSDVFATFDISYKSYMVKIYNDEEPIFSENVEYGYKITTNENTLTIYDRDGVETNSFTFIKNDLPYYKKASFTGFDVTRKERDSYVPYSSSTSSYVVDAPMNISAKYNETYEYFTVSIPKTVNINISEKDITIDTSKYFVDPVSQDESYYNYKVEYNTAIKPINETVEIDGINIGFVSFEETTYTENEVAGKKTDPNHIKHNVTLTPIFAAANLKVNFHIKNGDKENVIEKEVAYGSTISEVNVEEVTGKVCPLDWFIDKNILGNSNLDSTYSPFDLSKPITSSLDLYSIYVDKALSLNDNSGTTYNFEFDRQVKGYVLNGVEGAPTSLDMNSINEFKDKLYNFKAIKKLNIQEINVENITFPNTLIKLYNDSLFTLGCKGVGKTLDLSNINGELTIGSKAFRAMTSVSTIKLPQVASIGVDAFKECDRLAEIQIKNSKNSSLFELSGFNEDDNHKIVWDC